MDRHMSLKKKTALTIVGCVLGFLLWVALIGGGIVALFAWVSALD